MEKWFTSRLPDRFGISMRSLCAPSMTTAGSPAVSVVVPGLQLVSDPTAPFLPAPSLAFPDASGTVAPEMCATSRSTMGLGGATASAPADEPPAIATHVQAAASTIPRLTLPSQVVALRGTDRTTRTVRGFAAVEAHARAVILVEGVSDRIAVETLAARRGRDLAGEGVAV